MHLPRLAAARRAAWLALLLLSASAPAQDALLADQQGTTGSAADLLQAQGRVPLPADVVADGVTLRFIELGEFRASRLQGLEIDLINQRGDAVNAEITLTLTALDGPAAERQIAKEQRTIALTPATRTGVRISQPLSIGQFRVNLLAKVNGNVLLEKSFDFKSAGPIRLTCKPYLLSRSSYLVKAELRTPELQANMPSFRFKLLDRDAKKVLWESDQYRTLVEDNPFKTERRQTIGVEGLVQLGENPPGDYVIEVEVITPTTKPAQASAAIRFRLAT